jgi:DNA replicative helicase MCM subunit Mcm2 (Cdc46/Mcm family)
VAKYVEKRKLQREGVDEQSYMYVTPRTLLAIIRLSQSMAKLAQRQLVNQSDVDEALKLMDFSIRSLRTLKADSSKAAETKSRLAGRNIQADDRMTEVVKAVREVIQESRQSSLKVGEIFKALQKKRMITVDREELQGVLVHYSKLQIIMLDTEDNVIFL